MSLRECFQAFRDLKRGLAGLDQQFADALLAEDAEKVLALRQQGLALIDQTTSIFQDSAKSATNHRDRVTLTDAIGAINALRPQFEALSAT